MSESAAADNDLWTVQRILDWTSQFLAEKGIKPARREAEHLLAYSRNCQRIHLYTDLDLPLSDEERARMRNSVKRRANHEPLAYITGRKEFYGREFAVGEGVLVPRPETETLIDVCLELIPEDQSVQVAEVGFGSGCIAITLAKQRSQVAIVGTDVSETALNYARKNVAHHGVEDRVNLRTGHCFDPLTEFTNNTLDGVVSNPPYIRDDEFAELSPDVAQHEARTALTSGTDGLNLIREIIPTAFQRLKPSGWIVLEFDPAQSSAIQQLLQTSGFQNITVTQDLLGHDRTVCGHKPK